MKSILKKVTWLVLAVMIMALAFAGCQINSDNHEHSFSKDWTSDATDHWHAATCEHTKEVSDKAAHTFGDYVSNNDATTESDGTKTRKCSVCGYEDTVTDEKSKTVATPAFSVASGEVDSGTTVTITCSTEGAKIYYTTNGTEPTAESTEYTSAISVTPPMTLKAIAVKDGMNDSAVASASYTIKGTIATPEFSVASGAVNSGTSVTITCITEGAKIYYTTDGSDPTASSTEYKAAISVTAAVTLKAIAVKDGMNNSAVASASYTIKETVATPAFSVASGAVDSGTRVTITCSTEGAKIYYTTNGTEPTASSTEYTGAISVTAAITLKAIAVKSGMNDSAVASASYTIKETVATPAFSVASGAVNSGTSVTITCSTEGAKIYYTTDGTEPTAESTAYTAAISVTRPMTLKVIAVKDGMNNSAVASVSYTIKGRVATPTFSVASGAVDRGTRVTINCSTEGAKIYYTTDGSDPTASSTAYTAAISVTRPMTLKVIAVKDGMNNSAVASVSYTISSVSIPVELVKVKGGTVVGKNNTNNYSGVFREGRTVTLSDFYMSKYEVTKAQYKAIMEDTSLNTLGITADPSYSTLKPKKYVIAAGEEDYERPVENVRWYDAVYFCNLLSQKEGLEPVYTINNPQTSTDSFANVGESGNETVSIKYIRSATVTADHTKNGYRLPTEAEWEYAARGGDPSKADWDYIFSGADTAAKTSYGSSSNTGLDAVGWYRYNTCNGGTTTSTKATSGTAGYSTHQKGLKAPNALGIYDMSGNVSELCYDWYSDSVSTGKETDPLGSSSGSCRVVRGGNWCGHAYYASVCDRSYANPYGYSDYLGFRLVRSAQ